MTDYSPDHFSVVIHGHTFFLLMTYGRALDQYIDEFFLSSQLKS